MIVKELILYINYLSEQIERAGQDEKRIQYCTKFSGSLQDGISYYLSSGIGDENLTFRSDLEKAKNQIASLMKILPAKEEING
ncbi:MAG: hypothetical protein RI909_1401 [Bacteroidota bacterium]